MDQFDRKVWCLLGLPFDQVSLSRAVDLVHSSVAERRRLFLSTPNLNFLMACQSDTGFRNSVVNSDLSVADGMPLIWMARILGVPLPERVSGSGLFEYLTQLEPSQENGMNVFFFGGDEGIGKRACARINEASGSLRCTGSYAPGFGPLEEMSQPEIIDMLNTASIDFLVVSLGARKGQSWIETNRSKLKAPVISHLGAVINFVAGSVQRAPAWMQNSGLEWVWRIYQEPKLLGRYLNDGARFSLLFCTRVLPYALWRKINKSRLKQAKKAETALTMSESKAIVDISGDCIETTISSLRRDFCRISESTVDVTLDLSRVELIDGSFLGLCLLLKQRLDAKGLLLEFTGLNVTVKRIFHWNCADYIL